VRIIVNDIYANPHEEYSLTESEGTDIIATAKLHDLGKIAIPDSILLKPGRLTDEEFEIVKTHPTYAADMLLGAVRELNDPLLELTLDIAYYHHEKWNGSGYPKGLKETEIPLSARIVAVADVFDALTSERPYKSAYSARYALDILYEDSGKHFDPYLIDIVRRHESDFEAVTFMR
jgi:putative two-component system response regulator